MTLAVKVALNLNTTNHVPICAPLFQKIHDFNQNLFCFSSGQRMDQKLSHCSSPRKILLESRLNTMRRKGNVKHYFALFSFACSMLLYIPVHGARLRSLHRSSGIVEWLDGGACIGPQVLWRG